MPTKKVQRNMSHVQRSGWVWQFSSYGLARLARVSAARGAGVGWNRINENK